MSSSPHARPDDVAWLVAQQQLRDLYYRYCRGIDRRDLDLVRDCYHPDATDDHGEYSGGVDGFIEHARTSLQRFERTMHFLGNILVEQDDEDPDKARGEAYAFAHHWLAASSTKPARDFVVALRYVDDLARRDGVWRIARRVCVFEWSRIDPVGDSPYRFPEGAQRGQVDGSDPVSWPTLER